MTEFCTYGPPGGTYGGEGTTYGQCEGLLVNVPSRKTPSDDTVPATTGTPFDPDCGDERTC